MASIRVLITSWIEAYRKSFTLMQVGDRYAFRQFGLQFRPAARRFRSTACVAFEPAVWKTIAPKRRDDRWP